MSEELRQLFYPLGFVSAIAFSLRFLVQWIHSESQGKSVVTRSFWILSLIGNLALLVHSGIQLQYPVCLIQAINSVISLRNLNLMGKRPWSFSTVITLMSAAFILPTAGFLIGSPSNWLRVPIHNFTFHQTTSVSMLWHILGSIGVFLFALRFWFQWVEAEKTGVSALNKNFWRLSLAGAFLSLLYFFFISDLVNLIGPLFGIIPYLRNLMLLTQRKAAYGNP